MHQRVHLGGDEAIVDEEIFVDAERRVTALEVSSPIVRDAVAQRQVLRACRRADRIGLDEAEFLQSAFQRGRPEKAARDGIASQVIESDVRAQALQTIMPPGVSAHTECSTAQSTRAPENLTTC